MSSEADRTDAYRKLWELIKGIQMAMVTTIDAEGALRSRPMRTQEAEFDGHLWFFTNAKAAKVNEVLKHEQVNVSYAQPGDNRYVSVSGTAKVLRDQRKAKELWNPTYKAWFPQGLDDPDLALLRVDVHKAEYWDSPSGTMMHLIGLVKALATGRPYEGGENEKLRM